MRVRVRGPDGGTFTISLVDSATVEEFRNELSSKTGLQAFDLKVGYPPLELNLDQHAGDAHLLDIGTKLNGEQVIVLRKDSAAPVSKEPPKDSKPALGTDSRLSNSTTTGTRQASTPNTPTPTASAALSLTRKANNVNNDDPPEIPIPELNGTLVMRVMPDDNSCMFRAFGSAVLGDSLDCMHELRAAVAAQIQAQPEIYTAAVLEKTPEAYCRWVQREDAWGGAIELGILAEEWDLEICSIDVQTLRVDKFGEGKARRVVLVYSGIHYDVLALKPSGTFYSGEGETDIKLFDAQDPVVLRAALKLCKVLQSRHYYTDVAGFTVTCNVCGWSGRGEKSATQHAKQTGHMDFGEG